MASNTSKAELRRNIKLILKGADLSQLSAKKVRKQLEEKYELDLSDKKKDIDSILMELIEKGQDEDQDEENKGDKIMNGNSKEDQSENSENETLSDSESDFEAPEDTAPPKKKFKSHKKVNDEDLARQLQDEEGNGRQTRGRGSSRGKAAPVKKKKRTPKEGASKRENKYTEACHLSPALAHVVGTDRMKRSDVVKKMWEIVRERELQDPKNKQFMVCDQELHKVFGKKRVRTFGMMKYLKHHIFTADEVTGLSTD